VIDAEELFFRTKKLSLLLVEDYEPFRRELFEILSDYFLHVDCAFNGEDALIQYAHYYNENTKFYDLVISDIKMPVMDGVELCKVILEKNSEQKIAILSAHTDTEDLLELINLGIVQFIQKPIDDEVLQELLYRITKKSSTSTTAQTDASLINLTQNYLWNQKDKLLLKDNVMVELSRYEMLLLDILIFKREQVCTSSEIVQFFYDNNIEFQEMNIRSLISRMRKKLPKYMIKSIYKIGYIFTTKV
jgi:DNA-binding response OmpR family regulator